MFILLCYFLSKYTLLVSKRHKLIREKSVKFQEALFIQSASNPVVRMVIDLTYHTLRNKRTLINSHTIIT